MKRMMLSFKIKGDVISDHILMLCFQKESANTVSFWAYGEAVLNQKATFEVLNGRGD